MKQFQVLEAEEDVSEALHDEITEMLYQVFFKVVRG